MSLNKIKKELLQGRHMVTAWNDYAAQNSCESVYSLTESMAKFKDPQEVYDSVKSGRVNLEHRFLTYNGKGKLVSFDSHEDDNSCIDIDCLAEWLQSEQKEEDYQIYI